MTHNKHLDVTDLFVLLALADGPSHGYILIDQIAKDSQGMQVLSPVQMYRCLVRLEKLNLVTLAENVDSHYRKTYRITAHGRTRLKHDMQVVSDAARLATRRLG